MVLNPEALPLGSAGRRFALAEATVHPFAGTKDPRAPSGLVPAVVKWMNDDLDDETRSLEEKYPAVPLACAVGLAHQHSVTALRGLSAEALIRSVLVASTGTQNNSPDAWSAQETQAVCHLLQSVSILEVAQFHPTFHGLGAQATIEHGHGSLEVVAVLGRSHEECDRHIKEKNVPHRGQLLMISRDDDNTPWNPKQGTIFDQAAEGSAEFVCTNPGSGVIRIGYHDVLQAYRSAANEAALKGAIDAAIS